jgi:hypothetical protein
MTSKNSPKIAKQFYCEKCDYKCIKKSDYEKHLSTRKHEILTNTSEMTTKVAEYICQCGKQYKHRQSLNTHKKKCDNKIVPIEEIKPEPTIEFLLKENLEIKKDNLEMKNMMIDLCKKIEPTNITNNNNNTNNFNIQIFLNEECKDAMNLTDFIDSIQFTIEDMLRIGNEGQVDGISNVLIDKLNEVDLVKRPLHCSDEKKETIYVKEEDKWGKEPVGNPHLVDAIDKFNNKSINSLHHLEDLPDEFVKTTGELVKEPRHDKKIISKVAKNFII